jgi:hypothetical protein
MHPNSLPGRAAAHPTLQQQINKAMAGQRAGDGRVVTPRRFEAK